MPGLVLSLPSPPTALPTPPAEAEMRPLACSIIIVDSVYLTSSYQAAEYPSSDDDMSSDAAGSLRAPTRAGAPLSPPSTPPTTPLSTHMPQVLTRRLTKFRRKPSVRRPGRRECHGASQFIQLLLETYNKVTAVTSGDAAFTCILSRHPVPNTAILLLIDLDHPAPLTGPHAAGSAGGYDEFSDPTDISADPVYGLKLLKLVTEHVETGKLPPVVPIVMSCQRDPELMRQALLLGALDYLVKPVSAESIKTLWLNSVRSEFLRLKDARLKASGGSGSSSSSLTATTTLTAATASLPATEPDGIAGFDDAWLERSVVASFTPSALQPGCHRFPSMTGAMAAERIARLRERLVSWDIFPFDLSEDDLLRCICLMLTDGLNASNLHMPDTILHTFILTIRNSYYASNAYHNFHHAVDVLQAVYVFLNRTGLMDIGRDARAANRSPVHRIFQVHDIFALLIAAIGHDIGHPGVNNHFMVTCRSPLAALYHDKSVLEHFHATALCQIIHQCGLDLAQYNPGLDAREFRQVMVQTILATDMAAHFDYITKIQQLQAHLTTSVRSRTSMTVTQDRHLADRITVCSGLIKCADISNVTRPFHVAGAWTTLLNEEMSKQCDLERKLGYPVSLPVSTDNYAHSQVSFYRAMALPLFQATATLLTDLAFCVTNVEANICAWEKVHTKQIQRQSVQLKQQEKRKRFGQSWSKTGSRLLSRQLSQRAPTEEPMLSASLPSLIEAGPHPSPPQLLARSTSSASRYAADQR
ncbi:3',5'-cyclic-nucleotide phosphodiesterase [Dimargaris xerosporica]|nr:3',5'-cyclic-nucleotide phosphodiesterase [Dimargaris xerosporica]